MLSEMNLPEDIKRDISVAAEILMQDGCKEAYLFGSPAGGSFAPDSDIDLATVGLPKERFFAGYGRILSRVRRPVDLAALDYDQDFWNRLKEGGTLSRVARRRPGAKLSFELGQIQKELQVRHRVMGRRKHLRNDEVRVRAAASSLQSVYNGVEKMLELVLKEKGHAPKESSASHSEVLRTAVTSGIFSDELAGSLRDLMAFRHFSLHSYGFMIDAELLNPLVQGVERTASRLAKELGIDSP